MARIRLLATNDQQRVIQSPSRNIALFAGRRWGKTVVFKNRILYKSFKQYGWHSWYIAPCYAQAFVEFRKIAFHPDLQSFIHETRQQPFPEVTFVNGSRVGFRSFDRPDNLRGAGLHEVLVDEIQDILEDDFWPVIRPLVSDRRGNILVAGQFRGMNWYYEKFYQRGLKDKTGVYAAWRFPSSTGLAFQGEKGRAELQLLKDSLPKIIYDQECECIPVANQAAVFNYEDLAAIKRGSMKGPEVGARYILALDLGRVVDPTAYVVLNDKTREVVFAGSMPLGMRHVEQAKLAAAVQQRYNATVVIDSTGGATGGKVHVDAYVDEYRKTMPGLFELKWTVDQKTRFVQTLCMGVEKRELSIPAQFEEIHRQMAAYEFVYSAGGIRYGAPVGKHDDYVAALAMAWYAHKNRYVGDSTLKPLPGF